MNPVLKVHETRDLTVCPVCYVFHIGRFRKVKMGCWEIWDVWDVWERIVYLYLKFCETFQRKLGGVMAEYGIFAFNILMRFKAEQCIMYIQASDEYL